MKSFTKFSFLFAFSWYISIIKRDAGRLDTLSQNHSSWSSLIGNRKVIMVFGSQLIITYCNVFLINRIMNARFLLKQKKNHSITVQRSKHCLNVSDFRWFFNRRWLNWRRQKRKKITFVNFLFKYIKICVRDYIAKKSQRWL